MSPSNLALSRSRELSDPSDNLDVVDLVFPFEKITNAERVRKNKSNSKTFILPVCVPLILHLVLERHGKATKEGTRNFSK